MKLMLLAFLITAAGAGLLGRDGYRRVKGLVAVRLVAAATDEYLDDGARHAPWSWADFHPIGRLYVPRLEISQDILAGGVDQAMAFGLASLPYTASPAEAATADGTIGLAGHRSSFGGFIGDLRVRDLLVLDTPDGDRAYRVSEILVVPKSEVSVMAGRTGPGLALVTCHPTDGVLPTSMRRVVRAVPLGG